MTCPDCSRTHGLGVIAPAPTRRGLMLQAAALGAAALGTPATAAPPRRRIDVHHHMLPPQYLGETPPSGYIQRTFGWTPQKSLEEMDRSGVQASVLSFPTPLLWPAGIEPGRRLARFCNEYGAGLVAERPTRFGLFAGVPPLSDIDGALEEIAYAYDVLRADGVAVLTSYDGRYLGDPAMAPIWEALNRRAAVVFVHPTDPACCTRIANGVGVGLAEWPFDTVRAILSLWAAEVLTKWPRLRFIFSHGGGALPMIADRIDKFGRPVADGPPAHDAYAFFAKLYFDTANAASPPAFAGTHALAGPKRILFGSDYPYVPIARNGDYLERAGLDAAAETAIDRDNALALLPRLAAALNAPSARRAPWPGSAGHRPGLSTAPRPWP